MLASVPKNHSQELYTKCFRVAPDYPSGGSGGDFPGVGEGGLAKRKTAKEILEEAGISFPEGASVHTGGPVCQITVRNTEENLAKVEQFIKWMERENSVSGVVMTSHVLEAPAPMVRRLIEDMGGRGNHRAELDQLLDAVRQGKASWPLTHRDQDRIHRNSGARSGASCFN
jgi:hypothetical protein